ncbi:MAG: magnesium transporter [Burkholderiaceae bacterium]
MNDQQSETVERKVPSAHDPEAAQRALARVEHLLEKQRRVEALVQREQTPDGQKKVLVEQLVHRQHLTELKSILDRLHPADIAHILEALPINERLIVWDCVKADRDGEILIEVSDAVRETLIASMNRDELVDAVESLEADEIASIADDLPADVVDEVRESLPTEERAHLRASMSYPDDSVGALMDFEMISIREDVTLEVVLRYLRRFDALPNHTDQIFVVDRYDVLKGGLPLDRLLLNEPEIEVTSVMNTGLMTLSALDKTSEAAHAFERYDLVSAPVVDQAGRLIGRLTVDEVVDVIREEGEDAALAQAGLLEEEDLFASVWNSARNRWLWLAVNLGTAFFASRVIGAFESTIERVVALATLMTIVMGIAGNSGNQTMTLMIRSLALGQVTGGNARRLILKELAIAGLNGAVWGSIAGLVAWWIYIDSPRGWLIGLTLFLAMTLNMVIGSLVGMFVPLMLVRSGRDPALGSSVLLTFTTDSMGVFIFLGLATLFFL